MDNSVTDTILARHELIWKLNPYRIEDKNGRIIQSGPSFDLRDSVLKAHKERPIQPPKIKFRSHSTYPNYNSFDSARIVDENSK